jgi:chemotaxis regulatin CheY-phosphate phosphatase CheZ
MAFSTDFTDITQSTIQGHPGPASLKVQFNVACKNVKVTTMLAALKEQMDKYKQTLMSSAGVLANEKSNPSPEKTTTPEAAAQYETDCATLADTLKNLGRQLKKLETQLDDLIETDQEKIADFRDEMSYSEKRMAEMIDMSVKEIETFFADKAHIDDKEVRSDIRAMVAEHLQDAKKLLREIRERVKRADPNAPELPKEMIEKMATLFEPVLNAVQKVVDARRTEQAEFEQKANTFALALKEFRLEIDDLLKKFDRTLPGAAINHVTPLPPPHRTFSA